MRLRQVLDNVKQDDHVNSADAFEIGFVGCAVQHVQSGPTAIRGRIRGQFDAGGFKISAGLLEKESVGAAHLQQLAAVEKVANVVDALGEFTTQHGLGAEIDPNIRRHWRPEK